MSYGITQCTYAPKVVYLCGSISGLPYTEIDAYYNETLSLLPEWMIPLSPMRDKAELAAPGVGAIEKSYEDLGPLYSTQGIFTRDSIDVHGCDAVLANFTRASRVSIGSLYELAWAWRARKPIVIVLDDKGLHDHPFVRATTPYIFKAGQLREAIGALKSLLRTGV